ncbi:MAG: hypothetical protein ABF335_04525 [Alphaproteobacteria bacterium]
MADATYPFGWTKSGWRHLILWSFALVAMTLGLLAIYGTGEDGNHAVIRWTARTSLFAFLISFITGPLVKRVRNDFTRKLMQARRYWGLSFFISHMVHLVFIILAFDTAVGYEQDPQGALITLIGGGGAYVFITLMAITSTNGWYKRLGATNWRRLHLVGQYYAWIIFAQSYAGRAFAGDDMPGNPLLGQLLLAVLVAALVFRLIPVAKNKRS